MRGGVIGILMILVVGIFLPFPADAGNIVGRLEGPLGDGVHESFIWAIGAGNNAATARGSGFSWGGDYSITGLDGGTYNISANSHGGLRHVFLYGISVPGSGNLPLNILHTGAMGAEGFTGLDGVSEAGQTFVANGPYLWTVTAMAATGGVDVQMTIHEGGPEGPQVGPSITKGMGSAYPIFFHWDRGEVPLEPGKTYYVKMVRIDGPTWIPLVGKNIDPYPNGTALFEGVEYPQYDLDLGVTCIDDKHLYDVETHSGYRTDQQNEIGQTFQATGEELRYAQFMLAANGGMMRVSVHNGVGGVQIGPMKRTQMGTSVPGTVVWGPGEVPLTPGNTYYVKLVRDDGGLFGIYGTNNGYPNGQLYLDGTPVSADADVTFITKQVELPDIAVSNVQVSGITGQTATITWNTSVGASSYVQYWTGSTLEMLKRISDYDGSLVTSHNVTLTGLEPGTTHDFRVYSWRSGYDLASSPVSQFTTSSGTGTISGTVTASGGGALAEAKVTVEPGGFETETNGSGYYSVGVPAGTFQVAVSRFGYEDAAATGVSVTVGGNTVRNFALDGFTNLVSNGGFESNLSGWTSYGVFDGAQSDGGYSVPARTGGKWAGSVGNYDPKTGGIRQTVTVSPSEVYTLRGYIYTNSYDVGESRHGHAQGRMGYDPGGGTDPGAASVVWSDWAFTGGEWTELELTATSPGGQLTVFLETRHETWWGIPAWFIAGFDDISLSQSVTVTTGTVAGTVTAVNTGLPIEQALIEILGTGKSAYTNPSGQYSIPGVDPGFYDVRASKGGYDPQTVTNREVLVGETTTVNFSLTGEGLPFDLVNPSFEMGDATGWTWHEFDGGPADGVFGPDPWYSGITPYHGDKAYGVATNWGYKTGALYQKVAAFKGTNYSASCWIRTYQSRPGGDLDVRARIGINPLGGTDPTAGVTWGNFVSAPSGWLQATISNVFVNSTELTVFCEVAMGGVREWQIVAMDYFSLVPEGGQPTPTPTLTPTPPIPGGNLLINPGAETGDFTAWTTGGSPPGQPLVDPSTHLPNPLNHTGNHRFGMSVGWAVANCWQYQAIPVTPGMEYTTSLWACHSDGTDEHVQFSWIDGAFGGTENVLYDIGPSGPSESWSEYSGATFIPAGSTVTIVVRYLHDFGSNIASIHVDDMFVGLAGPSATETPTPTPVETPTPPESSVPAAIWAY